MDPMNEVRTLIRSGKKEEAWELLNRTLANDPQNEAAWLLAYRLASKSRKNAIIEKARQYLPSNSVIFSRPTFSKQILGEFAQGSNPRSNRTLAGGILFLSFLFCGGAYLIFFNSNLYLQLVATPTPQPTSRPTFVSTVTPTRGPTATFRPAHTATYTALIEETSYLAETLIYVQMYENALKGFFSQHTQLNVAPGLYWNQTWRTSMVVTMTTLVESAEALASVSPVPSKFASYRDSTVNLYNQTYAFVLFYANWLDGNNDGSEAAYYIENLNQAFSRMTRELEAVEPP